MSFAFFLWFSISLFLFGFWIFTSYVLYCQKMAWRFYAQKKKLRYNGNGFYGSPDISGTLGDHSVFCFTSDHSQLDERSQRRLISIEISLNSGLPEDLAVASGGMGDIVEGLSLSHDVQIDTSGWDDSYIVRTSNRNMARAYLTPARIEKLMEIMKNKRAWVILIFMNGKGLLRFDTPNPLIYPKDLDKVLQQLQAAASLFEIQDREISALQAEMARKETSKTSLNITDDLLQDHLGIELEDEA